VERRSFQVDDIHCDGCERTIQRRLGGTAGIDSVVADHRTDTVTVDHDPNQVDDDRIRELLEEAGFPVTKAIEPKRDDDHVGVEPERGPIGRYGLLVLGVAVPAVAGYAGYELYPRFDLPAAEGAGLLVLATGAGIASFFAPCSFPLLVTLLSRPAGGRREQQASARPLVFGTALSVGAAAFLLLSGLAIAVGGSAFFESVTFTSTTGRTLRIVVGALLIGLGFIQIGILADTSFRSVERLTKNLNRTQAKLRRRHPVAGYTAFGFFYLLAGFG
jgi:copper chaperone CopZ/cytochrome c biogenesis protein CcdA